MLVQAVFLLIMCSAVVRSLATEVSSGATGESSCIIILVAHVNVLELIHFFVLFCVCDRGVVGQKGFKNCSSHSVDFQCPSTSICSPQKDVDLCMCGTGYSFNVNYTNDADYCIPATNVEPSTAAPATTTTTTTTTTTAAPKVAAAPTTTTNKPTTGPAAATKAPPASNEVTKERLIDEKAEHHFLAGIMVPLLVVFAFVGAVYAARKYDLVERVQDYIQARASGRHRTNYANDFDEFDDPLLI